MGGGVTGCFGKKRVARRIKMVSTMAMGMVVGKDMGLASE